MRILIVDDHPMVRYGLGEVLKSLDQSIDIVAFDNAEDAVASGGGRFDLILLDLGLTGVSGVNAVTFMHENLPATPLVVFTGEEGPTLVRRCVEAGAMGFVTKIHDKDVFIPALKIVLAGGIYLPADSVLSSQDRQDVSRWTDALSELPISQRKQEILALASKGASNKAIADELNLAQSTIKNHLSECYRILDVKNRTEAVLELGRRGWHSGQGQCVD